MLNESLAMVCPLFYLACREHVLYSYYYTTSVMLHERVSYLRV